jgi:hypothetical protein
VTERVEHSRAGRQAATAAGASPASKKQRGRQYHAHKPTQQISLIAAAILTRNTAKCTSATHLSVLSPTLTCCALTSTAATARSTAGQAGSHFG